MADEKDVAEAESIAAKFESLIKPESPIYPAVKWPPKPETLKKKKTTWSYCLNLAVNIASICAVLPFLILAGVAANLNGHRATDGQWFWVYGSMNAVSCFTLRYILLPNCATIKLHIFAIRC
jgi:hypothetical protein